MSRLFACIISPEIRRDKAVLTTIARQFSYRIETLNDGILFDVGGLRRLVGNSNTISARIIEALQDHNVPGNVAIAETIDSACLLARQGTGSATKVYYSESFAKLPLSDLPIEQDNLNVFNDLGVRRVEDLLEIPQEELISRYGKGFRKIIDVIEQKSTSILVPNVSDQSVNWKYDLDLPVQDFEQLIFLLNHGFENIFTSINYLSKHRCIR